MATFDDMELERKLTVYDKGFDENAAGYGEYITRSGDIWHPRVPNAEPLRLGDLALRGVRRDRRGAAVRRRERAARRAGPRGAPARAGGVAAAYWTILITPVNVPSPPVPSSTSRTACSSPGADSSAR